MVKIILTLTDVPGQREGGGLLRHAQAGVPLRPEVGGRRARGVRGAAVGVHGVVRRAAAQEVPRGGPRALRDPGRAQEEARVPGPAVRRAAGAVEWARTGTRFLPQSPTRSVDHEVGGLLHPSGVTHPCDLPPAPTPATSRSRPARHGPAACHRSRPASRVSTRVQPVASFNLLCGMSPLASCLP